MGKISFNNIKNIISTAILSDVLDDLGIHGMLSKDFYPNFFGAKIFGRAKAIKVEELKPTDKPEEIYKGLEIFSIVEPGDIIIVKNELNDFAYWGELNTSLAMRAGVSGTIVDGVTRDNFQTSLLEYPVFSKGRYAKDIKNRGIIKELNTPIIVDDVSIVPGSLVYADIDGIIVLPIDREEDVIAYALEVAEKEKRIMIDVSRGKSIEKIIKVHGFF